MAIWCLGCHRELDHEYLLCPCGSTLRGVDCGDVSCQTCCPHDERDHGICLDCAHEEDPGEAIDRAMDALEDR